MNNTILITPEFNISQHDKKKSLIKINLYNNNNNNNNNKHLIYSITKTKIIKNYTILDDCTSIMLKASSIKTYQEFKKEQITTNKTNKLSHTILLKIVYYLSKQISYLLTNYNKCFYTYDPDNIIVIDDNIFIYISQVQLKDVKNNEIYIYSPISKKNKYLSPELLNISTLPIIIDYKTIYYSLGLLIKESLLCNETDSYTDDSMTKLHYFLERCLKKNPNERYLLYI